MNSGFILGERSLDGSLGILTRLSYPTWSFMESEIAMLRQMGRVQQPGPSAGGVQMESNICRIRHCIRLRPRCAGVKEISPANQDGVSTHIDHQRMGGSTDRLQPHFIVCSAQYMAEWPNMHWKRLSTRGNKEIARVRADSPWDRLGPIREGEIHMRMLARAVISARSNSQQKPASIALEGQAFWVFVQAFQQERQCKLNPKLDLIDVEVVNLQIIGQILAGDGHSSQARRLLPFVSGLVTRVLNIRPLVTSCRYTDPSEFGGEEIQNQIDIYRNSAVKKNVFKPDIPLRLQRVSSF
jgi:hypothetical protein